MAQYFLGGDDSDSLDSVSDEMMAQLLEEAQRVIGGAEGSGRDSSAPPGPACHPALDIDWSEGDAGFVDWLSDRPPSTNPFAA